MVPGIVAREDVAISEEVEDRPILLQRLDGSKAVATSVATLMSETDTALQDQRSVITAATQAILHIVAQR